MQVTNILETLKKKEKTSLRLQLAALQLLCFGARWILLSFSSCFFISPPANSGWTASDRGVTATVSLCS